MRSRLYTVQPMSPQSQLQAASSTSVFANGPLQAARLVLGPSIASRGSKDSLCARVWELRDDMTPSYTEFYLSADEPSEMKAEGRMRLRLASDGEWKVLLKILAICAAVGAISCFIILHFA